MASFIGKMIEREGAGRDPDIYEGSRWFAGRIFRIGATVTKGSTTNGGAARRYAWLSITAANTISQMIPFGAERMAGWFAWMCSCAGQTNAAIPICQ